MTKPLVRKLLPSPRINIDESDPSSSKSLTVPLLEDGDYCEALSSSQMLNTPTSFRMFFATPIPTVHHYWRKFDDSFMRPVFGGRGFVPLIPGSPTDGSLQQWK